MNITTRVARKALFVALLMIPFATIRAQHVDEMIYLPAARLGEAVEAAAAPGGEPTKVTFLEQRDHHASIMVRRAQSGEPELHEAFDDIYVVQSGSGVLHYGGTYEGARTVEAGELRGGTIRGGTRQPLSAGDVVVVPADVPHQVEVERGQALVYHVLKVRRGK